MAKASRELLALRKAEKAVRTNIRVLPDKRLNQNLDYFCGSWADAYRQGIAEAQNTLLSRVRDLISQQQRADDSRGSGSGQHG